MVSPLEQEKRERHMAYRIIGNCSICKKPISIDSDYFCSSACWKEYRRKTYPRPTVKKPSQRELESMILSCISKATDGCEVTPHEVCEHNHPSWLIYLGMI